MPRNLNKIRYKFLVMNLNCLITGVIGIGKEIAIQLSNHVNHIYIHVNKKNLKGT